MKLMNEKSDVMELALELSDFLHDKPVDVTGTLAAEPEQKEEEFQEAPLEKPMRGKHRRTRRERELHIQKKERLIRGRWTDSRPSEIDAKAIVETRKHKTRGGSTGWWGGYTDADHRGELSKGKPLRSPDADLSNPPRKDMQRLEAMNADERDYFGAASGSDET